MCECVYVCVLNVCVCKESVRIECVCVLNVCVYWMHLYPIHNPTTGVHEQQNTYIHLYTRPCLQTPTHTLPHLPTPLNYKITPTDHSSSTNTILEQNTTLRLHRAPQLIAKPTPNPLHVHYITQSHIQCRECVIAPQTGRNGAGELIRREGTDETAWGSAVVECGVLQ